MPLKCYPFVFPRTRYAYRRMRFLSLLVALTGSSIGLIPASAAALPACTEAARTFYPCEFSFDLTGTNSPYRDEMITVEFRSPSATTYLLRAFWAAKTTLKVRFSPTETGTWAYRVSSSLRQFDGRESTFSATDSNSPGFVSVANLRHWRTTNKQPHLWLSADLPFLSAGSDPEAWLDARKRDGFTHVRGALLVGGGAAKPLDPQGQPNFQYFDALDRTVLAAAQKGFVLDLLLADADALKAGILDDAANRELLVRYLVARYGAMNVTWNG